MSNLHSGDGWAPANPWEVVSECLCIFIFFLTYISPSPTKKFLAQPTSFLFFFFVIFPCPMEGRGEGAVSCVVLSCLPGFTHRRSAGNSVMVVNFSAGFSADVYFQYLPASPLLAEVAFVFLLSREKSCTRTVAGGIEAGSRSTLGLGEERTPKSR